AAEGIGTKYAAADHAKGPGTSPGHALQEATPVNTVVIVVMQQLVFCPTRHRFPPCLRDTNTNAVFVAEPQFCWRAARVRESREPALRMGGVSFVQTARGGKLVRALVSGSRGVLAVTNQLTDSSLYRDNGEQ